MAVNQIAFSTPLRSSPVGGVGVTSLTDELVRDLVEAPQRGDLRKDILERHGVHPQSLSDWRKIADGEMTQWRSGHPISNQMRERCRQLWIAILEAEIASQSRALQRLKRAK